MNIEGKEVEGKKAEGQETHALFSGLEKRLARAINPRQESLNHRAEGRNTDGQCGNRHSDDEGTGDDGFEWVFNPI